MSFTRPAPIAFLVAALLAAACGPKVAKPTEDSSPPSIVWGITNMADNTSQTQAGTAAITAKRGVEYLIVARGHDDQGLRRIELSNERVWDCLDDAGGYTASNSDPRSDHVREADANNQVETDLVAAYKIEETAMACQNGTHYTVGRALLSATATNFLGGATTAQLTINVEP